MSTSTESTANLKDRTLVVKAEKLKDAVSVVDIIANNAVTPEDRLVNLMVYNNKMLVTATDTSREIQVELDVNSNLTEVMSTQVSKISSVLENSGNNTIEVHREYLLLYKETGKIQLPKYTVNHKPFKHDSVDDVLNLQVFYKQLRTLSKHLTKEVDDTGSLFISDGFMYIRNRLFYGLTDLPTKNTYIFDKLTCKILSNICVYGNKNGYDTITLAIVDNGSSVLVRVGNLSFKSPMPVHDRINLRQLSAITNPNGFLVNKNTLIKVIREIKEVDGTSELDIIGNGERVIVKPSTELSLTEFSLLSKPIVIDESKRVDFTYTVSLSAFEKLLQGVQNEYVMIASTDDNIMMLITKEHDYAIRYYISVY